uniref:Uncharacterized protein n=2 Tax=Auxenochlorella protothecoides TaxID=3075 RepID=A0A1D2A256_AUXPR
MQLLGPVPQKLGRIPFQPSKFAPWTRTYTRNARSQVFTNPAQHSSEHASRAQPVFRLEDEFEIAALDDPLPWEEGDGHAAPTDTSADVFVEDSVEDSSYDSSDDDDGEDGAVIEEEWSVSDVQVSDLVAAAAVSTAAAERLLRGRRAPDPAISALVPPGAARRLTAESADAARERARLTPAALRRAADARRTHVAGLRIVSGRLAGLRLAAPRGDATRPMMGRVRGAAFDMLAALAGTPGRLAPGSTWLDLFAGTGAVGLEALSRGAAGATFVEADGWTARRVLGRNLAAAGAEDAADVHVARVEDFLKRSGRRSAQRPYDFVSVCPPYELVDYSLLYELLGESPLLHEETFVLMEYPLRLRHLILPTLGPLTKLRDRRYGRTFLALYGPVHADG